MPNFKYDWMRKKLPILILFVFMLSICGVATEITVVDRLPSETILFKLPATYANWKEMSRCVKEKEVLIEYIPLDQHSTNWTELICMQYLDKLSMNPKAANSMEHAMDLLGAKILGSYPGSKVTWKVIEKDKSNAIYEWILHEPFKDISPQHEVARAFLTDTGFHRVGFTRKNKEMSSEEREKWIKSFKDAVSVVGLEEAKRMAKSLSIVDRLKDSLNLGIAFENWKVIDTSTLDNGCTMVLRIPPFHFAENSEECLEIRTMPNLYYHSLDQLFEMENEFFQERSALKMEFPILKRSSNEIIYSFVFSQDRMRHTGVVRIFLSDQGQYIIKYLRTLPFALNHEEILKWKRRLEMIKISSNVELE